MHDINKKCKKIKVFFIILFLFIITSCLILLNLYKKEELKLSYFNKQEEFIKFYFEKKDYIINDDSTYTYYGIVLISDLNGIDYIKYNKKGEEVVINCNGKNKVAIDYEAKTNQEYLFEVKPINEEMWSEVLKIAGKQYDDVYPETLRPSYLSEYYGDVVYNYSPKAGGTWRLLYADENNAYLMTDSKTSVHFNDVMSGLSYPLNSIVQELNILLNDLGYYELAGDSRQKAFLNYITNDEVWQNYCYDSSNNKIATWAVGAPSIELIIASYNMCLDDDSYKIALNMLDANGYRFKRDNSTLSNGISTENSHCRTWNTLFLGNGSNDTFWCCSPGIFGAHGYIWGISIWNSSYFDANDGEYRARPVVCIPKSNIVISNNSLSFSN